MKKNTSLNDYDNDSTTAPPLTIEENSLVNELIFNREEFAAELEQRTADMLRELSLQIAAIMAPTHVIDIDAINRESREFLNAILEQNNLFREALNPIFLVGHDAHNHHLDADGLPIDSYATDNNDYSRMGG